MIKTNIEIFQKYFKIYFGEKIIFYCKKTRAA